ALNDILSMPNAFATSRRRSEPSRPSRERAGSVSNGSSGSRGETAAARPCRAGLLQPYQAASGGDLDRLGAAGYAQLLEQVRQVRLHCPLADVQRARDFLVRLAVGQEPERRHLARRELYPRDAFRQ